MRRKWELDRRTFLRGLGCSIGLPLLNCMIPSMARAQNLMPKRLLMVFFPFGTGVSWREQRGWDIEVEKQLDPIRNKVRYIRGLKNSFVQDRWNSGHMYSFVLDKDYVPHPGHYGSSETKTFEQLILDAHFRGDPKWKDAFIALNCLPASSIPESVPPIYANNLHYRTPTDNVYTYNDPLELHNRLFSFGSQPEQDERDHLQTTKKKLVVDFVVEDAKSLKRKLGSEDQKIFEKYLEELFETQRLLADNSAPITPSQCASSGMTEAEFENTGGNYFKRYDLFWKLVKKAFECDRTRVVSYMLATGGGQNMGFVGNAGLGALHPETNKSYHNLSHLGLAGGSDSNPNNALDFRLVNRFHFNNFMSMVQDLDQMIEADGTSILHKSLLVLNSDYHASQAHQRYNMQVALAGEAGGLLNIGGQPDVQSGELANVWMTCLDVMGARPPRFGASTAPIASLYR